MDSIGHHNPAVSLDKFGLQQVKRVFYNFNEARLYEEALRRGEGRVSIHGALSVTTGKHTGRCARDKFIVKDNETRDKIWWDNTNSMSGKHFQQLKNDFFSATNGKELFVQDLYAGADSLFRIDVRIISEYAWHALFIRHLLRRPSDGEVASFRPQLTIIDLPSFAANPDIHGTRAAEVIAINFSEHIVLIGSTEYAGEIKKSVFTTLGYYLPDRKVLPMHCSANIGADGSSTLFFGLSGTGKTTLSSDSSRILLGDDEHGWSSHGIYNFEGGCYAKTVRLAEETEPEICNATKTWPTILENVALNDTTREPDFDDTTLTENSRAGYPLSFIPNASAIGIAPHPKYIIFLTADSTGILPPLANLNQQQAMYHFLSGYTSKVAGTEVGIEGHQATFSAFFGAPFMVRQPNVYASLLKEKMLQHNSSCWLLNSGWIGDNGSGGRISIALTRRLLAAIINGELDNAPVRYGKHFRFRTPLEVKGIDSKLLNPRSNWSNIDAFDRQAKSLISKFRDNFKQFENYVAREVTAAAPG